MSNPSRYPGAPVLTHEDVLALASYLSADARAIIGFGGPEGSAKNVSLTSVAPNVPFLIRLREGLSALDVDGRDAWPWAEECLTILEERGSRYIRAASGSPEHELIVFTVPAGHDRVEFARRLNGLPSAPVHATQRQPARSGSAIRPPCSPHLRGLPTRLIEPKTLKGVLAALKPLAPSEDAMALLTKGESQKDYRRLGRPSRLTQTQAFAAACVNAGLNEDDFLRLILNPQHMLSAKWIGPGVRPERARSQLSAIWNEQVEFVAQNPPKNHLTDVRRDLRRLQRAANGEDWEGGARPQNAWHVLSLLIRRGQLGLTTSPSQSQRSIAEGLGITRGAVISALRLLEKREWLKPLPSEGRGTGVYELNMEKVENDPSSTPSGGEQGVIHGSEAAMLRSHDVFARGGLPQGAADTYLALSTSSYKAKTEIREDRLPKGLGKRSIDDHLKKLHAAGLADTKEGCWKAIIYTHDQLDHLARLYGTDGRQDRRMAQHHLERTHFRLRTRTSTDPLEGVG